MNTNSPQPLDEAVKIKLVDLLGPDRVLDRPEELASFAYDAFIIEARPACVVLPKTTQEVSELMKIASAHGVPVTARGAGTSLCGGSVPIVGGIVVCFSNMDKIIEINTADRYAIVEPGVVNTELQAALAPQGFFYPPDPSSMGIATIGGNIAQNAGGPRCLKYGVTMDYLLGIEVVMADGRIVRFGSKNVKDVTGYRMAALFCGSEGTLGLVTQAIVKVAPKPETSRTLTVNFKDLDDCAQSVSDIIGAGIIPAAMELMDQFTLNCIEDSAKLGLDRSAQGALLIDVDGPAEVCAQDTRKIIEKLHQNNATHIEEAVTPEEQAKVWMARRSAYGVFAKLAPDILTEDVTVPVSQVPEMVRRMKAIADKYDLTVGVLAHAGDGNMHPMIPADRSNPEEFARVEKAFDEIFEAGADLGGTLSGEHGIGLAKAKYMPLVMDQDSRDVMAQVKKALDPAGILNPGKFI